MPEWNVVNCGGKLLKNNNNNCPSKKNKDKYVIIFKEKFLRNHIGCSIDLLNFIFLITKVYDLNLSHSNYTDPYVVQRFFYVICANLLSQYRLNYLYGGKLKLGPAAGSWKGGSRGGTPAPRTFFIFFMITSVKSR